MEEKKLTDEEIVRALDLCANGLCDLSCPAHNLQNTITCQDYMNKLVLDLIHRLQSENKELKSPKFASWKLKFFRLKEEFDKELSEHEEFTKKAKAEIERLKIDIKNEKNWGKIQTKQAVKDTAKEILHELLKWLNQSISFSNGKSLNGSVQYGAMNKAYHEVKRRVKKIAESKGVEVE